MGHNISDRSRERRDAKINGEEIRRQVQQRLDDDAFAASVVDVWNRRLTAGQDLFFTPSIGAAIRGGKARRCGASPVAASTGPTASRASLRLPPALGRARFS